MRYEIIIPYGTPEMMLLRIFRYMWNIEKNENAECYRILEKVAKIL